MDDSLSKFSSNGSKTTDKDLTLVHDLFIVVVHGLVSIVVPSLPIVSTYSTSAQHSGQTSTSTPSSYVAFHHGYAIVAQLFSTSVVVLFISLLVSLVLVNLRVVLLR